MVDARCNCGGLTLTLTGPSRLVVACHCLDCQRRTGAPFGVGAFYPADAVAVSGAPKEFIREAASGGKASTPAPAPAREPTQIQRWISEQSSKALDVIIDIGIAGLLAYFLLAVGDAFRRKLVRVAGPTLAARRITVEILDEIDAQVQRYLLTMLIINTLIGLATWGILAAFGVAVVISRRAPTGSF